MTYLLGQLLNGPSESPNETGGWQDVVFFGGGIIHEELSGESIRFYIFRTRFIGDGEIKSGEN